MRQPRHILLASALLLATASCAWPPPGEVAAPPPPAPVAAPSPFAWLWGPPGGRLTLSNFSFATAHVQAVVTSFPDCAPREGTAASDFILPLNGTRVIEAAPGADVCWRRSIEPGTTQGPPPSVPGWTEWSRVYTSSGRSIDSRL